MTEPWRGLINMIVHGVQFQELTEEFAAQLAGHFVKKPEASNASEQYRLLAKAVEHGTDLNQLAPDAHSEESIRTFVSKMLVEMDKLRPWTEPPVRALEVDEWLRFRRNIPIAVIKLSIPDIQPLIDETFRNVAMEGRLVCILQLQSGAEVALASAWWPESNDIAVLLPDVQTQTPTATINELIGATELNDADIQRLY